MATMCGKVEKSWRGAPHRKHRHPALRALAVVLVLVSAGASRAAGQERILFPAIHDARAPLLERIRNEQVRIDVAVWLLGDRLVTQALVDKHRAGVPVRVIGDRAGIFESDPHTRAEFVHLASSGVPVRLRYHPTWFPEIMHWKAAIFAGQNLVQFGSANYTTFELAPWSPTNFKDETAFFTDDPAIVRAFLTMFDRMWADTANFLDWPEAYRLETGSAWNVPMTISRARLEPDHPTSVPGMVWAQGRELLSAMIAEIEREPRRVDLVSYRLTDPGLTDALIRRHQAGVAVRVFIEPTQYRNAGFPEYWLVGAMADRLWTAGVPVKVRTHEGLTHMKSLVTSSVALIASSNFTEFWQRDHNYFVSAASKPGIYMAMQDRFEQMWHDAANYRSFQPLPPNTPALQAPASGSAGASTTARLAWRRAPFATAFDVYIGRSAAELAFAGRVNAVLSAEPPATYSFAPGVALQPSTRYFWRVIARTGATDRNPSLVAASEIWSFTTGAGGSTAPPPSGCTGDPPGSGWTCVNGGWVPPDGWSPPSTDAPAAPSGPPPPAPSTCTTVKPGTDWVCVNGGWVPPDSPLAAGSSSGCATPSPGPGWTCAGGAWVPPPAQPSPSSGSCTTGRPGPDWFCFNGGWLPPGYPLPPGTPSAPATGCAAPAPGIGWTCVGNAWQPPAQPGSCATPDPFVVLGGGVCVNGGWVPRGHPAAGGR